ncbi:VanW family protein [Paenibacillus cremeus]|uniref:Uncharacterized protein n=1 Tax=Paenibacillus cremeus TaxID=2163881 RepID=A0A559KE65_9BACL|nr:VanW family protein [Paenibacillus cremeus]TVY10408.1 hypothetical protein FPZ49_08405 [Paenibacillus cremeus]
MRERRKSSILRPFKWIALLVVVGGASVAGLSAAGLVQWNPDKTLDRFMFWKTPDQTATGAVVQAAAAPQPNAKGTAQAAGSEAGKDKAQAPAATAAAPAPAPAAKPAANASGQLLAQAQSLIAVSASERAWLDQAGAIKLEPGKLFSYNTWFKDTQKGKTLEKKEAELSHLAGLLYETALRTGMKVGDRYAHSDIPAYAASGFDVEYVQDQKDLTFYNPFDFPITVGVTYNGDTPILTMNGTPSANWKAPKVTVNKESFSPDKVVLTDYTLAGKGEVKRSDGLVGLLVKVYADWKNDGKDELLYKDFYAPHPVVIARMPSPDDIKATEFK